MNTPKYLLVHTTDYPYFQMQDQRNACEGWHRDRGFPVSSLGSQIGYHYLFTGGKEYQCRADTDEKQDGISMNFQSIGLAVGFDGDIEPMPAIEYGLLKKRLKELQRKYNIPDKNVRFHRFWAKDKTCPGTLIGDVWLKNLLSEERITANPCLAEEKQIQYLKQTLSWYDKLVSILFKSKLSG